MFSRRAASEFPNDNPELHDGLVWACPAPLGRALPTLRLRPVPGVLPRVLTPSWEPEPHGQLESSEAVAESAPEPYVEASEPVAEQEPTAALDNASPPGPFAEFVTVLARITLRRGATRVAAVLTALCEHGRIAAGALDDAALRTLIARRVVAPSGTHATAEFLATLDAWRGVLEGTASDLTACGAITLDTWAAELLAAMLNAPSGDVPELRRELRRAGVAAFGLLAVA